jgi:DNA-binding transcriptional LysR family regulator
VLAKDSRHDAAHEFLGPTRPLAVALRVDAHEKLGEKKLAFLVYREALRAAKGIASLARAYDLAPVTRKICATPAYFRRHGIPRTPADLAGHNCLTYPHSNPRDLWRLRGPDGDIEVPATGNLRLNDDEALSAAVLGGLGVALLPTFIVGRDLQAGRLRAVLSGYVPA